jgi:ribosomal protein L12E/L44/L45/RPP1/RPP2
MAEFESQGGRMLLKNWQQVATDDVWMTRANEAAAAASAAATKAAAAAVPASH